MIGTSQRRAILSSRRSRADDLRALLGGHPGLFIDFTDDSSTIADLSTPANSYRGKAFDKLTFTRASTRKRFNSAGLLEDVASGAPAIDYDPIARAINGLQIEGARTNLLTYSETASNAAWTKTACSIGASLSQGGFSLDLLTEDASTGTHQITQGVSFTSGTTYTFSRVVKAKERTRVLMSLGSGAFSGFAIGDFDLNALTATSTGGTAAACAITALGGGLYRCAMAATATASATVNCITQLHNGTSNSYTGNGTSGLYIGAAQLELGAIPSSYIPTAGATVTRAGEDCKLLTSAFPASATGPYTLFCKGIMPLTGASDAARVPLSLSTNSSANSRYFARAASGSIAANNVAASSANSGTGNVTVSALAAVKMAARFDLNNNNAAINGTLGTNDTVCAYPSAPTQLNIGNLQDGGTSHWHGWIQQIAVIPVALTDVQLQAVTA